MHGLKHTERYVDILRMVVYTWEQFPVGWWFWYADRLVPHMNMFIYGIAMNIDVDAYTEKVHCNEAVACISITYLQTPRLHSAYSRRCRHLKSSLTKVVQYRKLQYPYYVLRKILVHFYFLIQTGFSIIIYSFLNILSKWIGYLTL
jgi:hypothetical protein